MSRARQVADRAAAWLIRQEDGDWSDEDQAAFDAWLAQSDAHKAAYWRLEHSWRQADRVRALGAPVEPAGARRVPRRPWKPAAVAASLLAVVVFGAAQLGGWGGPSGSPPVRYATSTGGHETVRLADGSRIELNTRTSVRAGVSPRGREAWLDSGEALFEIAPDPERPFIVHAGPRTVTVLGTVFSVRRDHDRVTVSVLEGRVRIDDAADPAGAASGSATLVGGMTAISRGGSTLVTQRSVERVQNALAWRDGMLVFDQTTLADVAAEFNRYNTQSIVVTDPETAAIRIGGAFQAANVEAFVRLLRDAYGLKVVREGDVIKISA